MNGSIRVSAKTVEEAITEASIQLAVTSDRLGYEIIEKGREGFLGIGVRQAVIEAWRKREPQKEKPKESPETRRKAKIERKSDLEKTPAKEAVKKEHREKVEKAKEEKEEKSKKKIASEGKSEKTLEKENEEGEKAVETFLKKVLDAMGLTVEFAVQKDEEGALCIDIKGEHMGVLIGKRGQTLDALQYLTNRVANRQGEGHVRVKLDTENYREKREETLQNLARNIAYKVKRTKKPISLEPMNPYERRIIHSALQSDPRILTRSEGEEPYRKVVISLKK